MSTPQGAQASEGCIQSWIGKQLRGDERDAEKKKRAFVPRSFFFFSQLWPPFLKATPMASRLNAIGDASMFAFLKAGWPGIRRAVELHGWAFCSSVPLARCRCKPVSTTTTLLSQRLAIVIVNFRRRFLSSPLFFDVWFLLPFIFFKSTHQHTGALRHRWHEKSLRSGVSWICLHVGAFHREIIPHSLQKKGLFFLAKWHLEGRCLTWFVLLHAKHRHLLCVFRSVCVCVCARGLVLLSLVSF